MTRLLSLCGALALVTVACATGAQEVNQPGRMIFFSQGCYGCHRIGVAGTPIAHDLSRIGRKYSEADLVRWLRDPASQKPGAHMPRLAITDDEIKALASYLSTLR